ncbi:IS3 family transposase [Pallidibacillus thermolactis]|uniref:IS3 family transposase n=1 Tax=Pallidibacillus thermolactis TaxID=251051 RepID=UPI0021DA241F|nr:IS3 family transposase [Pallidibacillus thermolactis]MCU9602312.1 IS3 family transposase [Pallidibacillus thermolactis subsp. kokeshiiformis]
MKQKRKRYSPEFKAQVVLEILKEEKSLTELSSEYGIHVNQLRKWKTQFLEQMPQLFQKQNKDQEKMKADYEEQIENLYAEVGRLTTQLSWLKKNLASTTTRQERVNMIEWQDSELSITKQAELLSLNRSSLYYKPVGPSAEDVAIKHRIDEIYTKYPFYGSRRITALLNQEGVNINRKRVQRHMREMGIQAVYPGPNLSKRNLQHRIYPYLLKGVNINYPNHVWSIDITYIRLQRSWMYLAAVIDWYSRYVISWELDQSLEIGFILDAVQRAFSIAKPVIFNSDQGSHFTSPKYINLLNSKEVQISMDSKGRALDNIIIERFWRNIKYEEVYLKDYESPREARINIRDYIDFYNYNRPHQSLDYKTKY